VWAGYFESFLKDGREWLLGSVFSVADIAVFTWFSEFNKVHPECFAAAPHVLALVARVGERPNIKAYLAARPETDW
jgi:glutathione S-transferase